MAAAAALALSISAGVGGVSAVPGVVRTSAVAIAFFGLSGWGLTNALVRGRLAEHRLLLVLPIGAVCSSFTLAVLGLLHVPFAASLALVLVAAVAATLRWRTGPAATAAPSDPPRPSVSRAVRLGLPAALATLVALISLIPVFRSGFETITGQNGDAILVAGSAVLVQHAPPTATRNDLPINRIPLQWRSKYPIYYALAAVSTLAGQTPIQAFGPVSALVLGMTALGLFLFARYALRAPPWVAVAAVILVPLDRIVMYVTIHPYYNELWAQFTLPLILLFGWLYLREPSRRGGALFATFLVFGLLVYPLMVPFPVLFLVPFAWRQWRRRAKSKPWPDWLTGLRRPWGARAWISLGILVVAIPIVAVLVRGFVEKVVSALDVLLPGTSLANWTGTALAYLPAPRFVGIPGQGVAAYAGLAVLGGLALLGLRRVRLELRWAMGVMVVVTALVGVYFRLRGQGQLFYFKDFAFLGPYVLILALMGLAALLSAGRRPLMIAAGAAIAALAVLVPIGASQEIDNTFDQATRSVLDLGNLDRALPRGSSIRVDVPPLGWQLWAAYMLHDHPLSARTPLGGFFPHPPWGRKADYIVTFRALQGRPPDAVGAPLFQNAEFQLWRMNPQVPGPDISRRGLVWDVTKITF